MNAIMYINKGEIIEVSIPLNDVMESLTRSSSTATPDFVAKLATMLVEKGIIDPEEIIPLLPPSPSKDKVTIELVP